MLGCILRVVSTRTAIESLIKASGLRPFKSYRKGEPLISGSKKLSNYSGFNVDVSQADDLDSQVSEAIRFLKKHSAGLRRLRRHRSFKEMTLDFGVWNGAPQKSAQFFRLPVLFVELAGKSGISFERSLYDLN
jgi:hypothetical protein